MCYEFKKVNTKYSLKLNVVTRDFHLFMNAKLQTAASQSLKATASAAVDS
jgi:hypothetical protein